MDSGCAVKESSMQIPVVVIFEMARFMSDNH